MSLTLGKTLVSAFYNINDVPHKDGDVDSQSHLK